MAQDLTGNTIAQHYRFDICLGEGTFAKVYRVHDTRRNVDLAAKVLRSDIANEEAFLRRFKREGDVLARLQHPNIVRYYDLIESDDAVFILMDYVPGETLQATLYHLGRPFRIHEIFEFLKPLTAALHFAHGEGVIHRDLKPANVLLHENGNLLVTDFGIAGLLDEASTSAGHAMGTPLYMAPEQITSSGATPLSDVYSLGVVLYQLLTRTVPFSGKHPSARGKTNSERITYEHLHIPPSPPRLLEPDIPEAVEQVVLQCLAKEVQERPKSVRAVYDALAEAIGAEPSDLAPLPNAESSEMSNVPLDIRLPEVSQFVNQPSSQEEQTASQLVQVPPSEEIEVWIEDDSSANDVIAEKTLATGHQAAIVVEGNDEPTANTNPFRAKTLHSSNQPHLPPVNPAPPHKVQAQQIISTPNGSSTVYFPAQQVRKFKQRYGPNLTVVTLIGIGLILLSCLALAIYGISPSSDNNNNEQNNNAPPPTVTASGGGDNNDEDADDVTSTPDASPEETVSVANPPTEVSVDPSTSNLIVYSSHRTGSHNIFITNANGTANRRQLTFEEDLDQLGPAWSPDGTRIAFYGRTNYRSNGDIYIMDADGANVVNITDSPSNDDLYPTWSPDGTQLVFHSNQPSEVDESQDFELYIYDLEDVSFTQLTFNNVDDYGADWSPDGSQIAFYSWDDGVPHIFTINPDGTDRQRLTPEDVGNTRFPTWSPDGEQLAFHVTEGGFSQIYVMNKDGSGAHPLLQVAVNDSFPDWSHDGSKIIFQRVQVDDDGDEISGIYEYDFETEEVQSIGNPLGDFLPEWHP